MTKKQKSEEKKSPKIVLQNSTYRYFEKCLQKIVYLLSKNILIVLMSLFLPTSKATTKSFLRVVFVHLLVARWHQYKRIRDSTKEYETQIVYNEGPEVYTNLEQSEGEISPAL